MKTVTLLASLLFATSVFAAEQTTLNSVYQKINDASKCEAAKLLLEGSNDISYQCQGPTEEIKVDFGTGNDYDSLLIQNGLLIFSLNDQMYSVGGFAGLGNDKGVIEWIVKTTGSYSETVGLIVRFSGSDVDGKMKSKLAVYGLGYETMCFKGFTSSNAKARKIAKSGECVKDLSPENAEVFSVKHSIVLAWASTDKKTCEKDAGGKWVVERTELAPVEETAYCVIEDAEDVVKVVESMEAGGYLVTVDTVGTNIHMCSFQAPAVKKDDGKIQVYTAVVTEDLEEKCEVTVTVNGDQAEVASTPSCRYFCGFNAQLDFIGDRK